MSKARWTLIALLGVLLLVDGVIAFRLIENGRPHHWVVASAGNGAAQLREVPIPMTASDWAIALLFVMFNALLGYCVWHVWRRARGAVQL